MNGYTLEQKIDICLRYIAADTTEGALAAREEAIAALQAGDISTPARSYRDPDINDMIYDLLKDIGMPPHLAGYTGTFHALRLIMENRDLLKCAEKGLFSGVAVITNSTWERVSRNIRHAVEVVFDRCDPDILRALFGNTASYYSGKLTNVEFLAACEVVLRRRMKDYGYPEV